jgi:hypothetical protein
MPPVLSTPTITLLIAHSFAVIPLKLSALLLQKSGCFLRSILYEARRYYKRTVTFSVLFLFHASKQPVPQHSLLCILTLFIQFSINCVLCFYVGMLDIIVRIPTENEKISFSVPYYCFSIYSIHTEFLFLQTYVIQNE